MGAAAAHGAEFIVILLGVAIFGVIRWATDNHVQATPAQRISALVALVVLAGIGLYSLNAVTSG
jgi:hypothetical protein